MISFTNFIGYYAGQNPSPTIQKSSLSSILQTLELIKTIRCLKGSVWMHLYKTDYTGRNSVKSQELIKERDGYINMSVIIRII